MPYKTIQYANIGTGTFGHFAFNQPTDKKFFELDTDVVLDGDIIFRAATGSLMGFLPFKCQDVIFTRIEYENSQEGCERFTMKLNKLPEFPLQRFTQIQILVDGVPDYLGYIWETPKQGVTKLKEFEFKGFGMKERLKRQKVVNPYKFDVSTITLSSPDIVINVATSIPVSLGVLTGLKAILRDAEDSKNNGVFTIVAYDTIGRNWIQVLKPNGVAQTIALGKVTILPDLWSNPNLISDILSDLLINYLPDLPISYDVLKIQNSAGYTTTGAIDFDGMTGEKVFQTIRQFLGELWRLGVDATGSYFLDKIDPTIQEEKFFTGFQVLEPDLKEDMDSIKNNITVLRSKGKAAGAAGFIVAATASDPTSIAKFGIFDSEEQIPGYFEDSTATDFANAILATKSQPIISGNAKNMRFKRYKMGVYGYVTSPDDYIQSLQDMDNLTGWASGPDLSVFLDNVVLVDGSRSHRISFTDTALNETHIFSFADPYKLYGAKKITLWVRANQIGSFIKFGIGSAAWNDFTFDISVLTTNIFVIQIIDISGLGLTEINFLGFQFFGLLPLTSYDVWIDKIEIEFYNSIHYSLPLKNCKTVLDTHRNYCDLTFGQQISNTGFGEYIQGIKGLIDISKMNLKDN